MQKLTWLSSCQSCPIIQGDPEVVSIISRKRKLFNSLLIHFNTFQSNLKDQGIDSQSYYSDFSDSDPFVQLSFHDFRQSRQQMQALADLLTSKLLESLGDNFMKGIF